MSVKLAAIIGDILRINVARVDGAIEPDFGVCEPMLESWATDLYASLDMAARKEIRASSPMGPLVAIFLMMHDAAINAIYLPRTLVLLSSNHPQFSHARGYIAKLRAAAMRTVDLIDEVLEADWADYVPTQRYSSFCDSGFFMANPLQLYRYHVCCVNPPLRHEVSRRGTPNPRHIWPFVVLEISPCNGEEIPASTAPESGSAGKGARARLRCRGRTVL
jgi:hypothetical protein